MKVIYKAKIDALYTAYPAIVKGPDFWTYFQSNQSLISGDGVHPSPSADGYIALRQLWADTVYTAIYSGDTPTSVPTAITTAAPDDTISPTDAPTETPAPTAVPTATPYGVTVDPTMAATESPTIPPDATAIITPGPDTPPPTTPPDTTAVPTNAPGVDCTCTNLCTSTTAITVPYTYDGAGEFCCTSSSLGIYVNSWNKDSVIINNIICTNSYVSSATITAINGVCYIYHKGSYGWSHIEIK